jgi:alcohol dehydrogenase
MADSQSRNSMTSFDHRPRTRLVFGAGTVDRAGVLARELGATRVLLVTDAGLIRAGHASHVERALAAEGLPFFTFGSVRENPTTRDVEDCVQAARSAKADLIIGLGGGSSMDTAKGCNFLFTNGGRMADYWGVGKATKPMLPLIAIPTTAGTGSECQSAALIADEESHQKMACLDPKAAARVAILDPSLTLSQPPRVTACTGIDAITHAVETAVTSKRTPLSAMYSKEAFALLVSGLPQVLADPDDLEARGRMLLGAAFAGTAIENSMLGAAHSAANPLTAHYGVVHGEAVGLMLPQTIRFNAIEGAIRERYAELARAAGIAADSDPSKRAVDALLAKVERLLNLAEIPRSLGELGVPAREIPRLADEAARQWTAQFNPRPIAGPDFAALYEAALCPRAGSV